MDPYLSAIGFMIGLAIGVLIALVIILRRKD